MFKSASQRVTTPRLFTFQLTTKNLINFYTIFTSRFSLVVLVVPINNKKWFLSRGELIFNYELALFAENQHV